MNAYDLAAARALFPEARDAPTPLLAHLTGEHAARIAVAWSAPHLDFLALTAARRHLAAIALRRAHADDVVLVRDLIERAPLRDALGFALRPVPRGLARALTFMGETLWRGGDYDRLLDLLHEPHANLVLRHAPEVTVDLVATLNALPPALRAARILANLTTPGAAQTLTEAFHAARFINPKRAERDLVLAWARANTDAALMRAALDALKPDRFGRMGPAPELGKPYRRLAGRAGVEAAALRFRNCVAGYMWELAADELAFYVWDGEPAALVALKRDVGGWRFAEALAAENYPLPELVLRTLAADLERAGVRVGQPIRGLTDRLEALAEAAETPAAPPPTVAARLGLGQLWR